MTTTWNPPPGVDSGTVAALFQQLDQLVQAFQSIKYPLFGTVSLARAQKHLDEELKDERQHDALVATALTHTVVGCAPAFQPCRPLAPLLDKLRTNLRRLPNLDTLRGLLNAVGKRCSAMYAFLCQSGAEMAQLNLSQIEPPIRQLLAQRKKQLKLVWKGLQDEIQCRQNAVSDLRKAVLQVLKQTTADKVQQAIAALQVRSTIVQGICQEKQEASRRTQLDFVGEVLGEKLPADAFESKVVRQLLGAILRASTFLVSGFRVSSYAQELSEVSSFFDPSLHLPCDFDLTILFRQSQADQGALSALFLLYLLLYFLTQVMTTVGNPAQQVEIPLASAPEFGL